MQAKLRGGVLILWTNRINTQILQAIKILHSYNMKTKYCISVFSQLYSCETWCFLDSRNSLCALVSSPFSLAASAKTVNFSSVVSLSFSSDARIHHTSLLKPLISRSMCSLCKLEPIKMWDIMSACWTRDKDAVKSRIIWDAWPPYPQGPQPMVLHARYVGGMRVYGSIGVKETFILYFINPA